MLKKILAVGFVFFCMCLYFPVNRLITSGGYNLQIDLDNLIPLIPIFVIPYLLAPFLWAGFIIYSNFKSSYKKLNPVNITFALAGIVSALIYFIIPTYVARPIVYSTDIFSKLITILYSNDNAYNASPSGHTFYTVLCFLFLCKLKPKYSLAFFIVSALIILSTLFTKQHNIFDVITGILFAVIAKFGVDFILKLFKK